MFLKLWSETQSNGRFNITYYGDAVEKIKNIRMSFHCDVIFGTMLLLVGAVKTWEISIRLQQGLHNDEDWRLQALGISRGHFNAGKPVSRRSPLGWLQGNWYKTPSPSRKIWSCPFFNLAWFDLEFHSWPWFSITWNHKMHPQPCVHKHRPSCEPREENAKTLCKKDLEDLYCDGDFDGD
jgi:hypothetical protein